MYYSWFYLPSTACQVTRKWFVNDHSICLVMISFSPILPHAVRHVSTEHIPILTSCHKDICHNNEHVPVCPGCLPQPLSAPLLAGCQAQPQTQTPAGEQVWAQRRAAPWSGSNGGRAWPTEPPANRAALPKPLNGKTWSHCGGGEVRRLGRWKIFFIQASEINHAPGCLLTFLLKKKSLIYSLIQVFEWGNTCSDWSIWFRVIYQQLLVSGAEVYVPLSFDQYFVPNGYKCSYAIESPSYSDLFNAN